MIQKSHIRPIFSLLLILLLMCFVGCGDEQTPPTETEPETPIATASQTEPPHSIDVTQPLVEYDLPLIAMSAVPMDEDYLAADGTLLLRYTYQDLVLTLKDPQVADMVTYDFLNLVDPSGSEVAKALQDARTSHRQGKLEQAHIFRRNFNPMRLDQSILSLYGTQTLFDGTASVTDVSVTYDLLTGHRLSLNQILVEDYSAVALAEEIIASLSQAAEQGALYSDYVYVISQMFSTNAPIENWYLSNEGLCFYFAPYEIAPHSEGMVTACVPYSRLSGLLREQYFPEETVDFYCTLTAHPFQDADLTPFSKFAELNLDPHGDAYILHVSGAAANFRLVAGSKVQGLFLQENTLLAASTLCHTDALVLKLSEDSISRIWIIYDAAGETVLIPLSTFLNFG